MLGARLARAELCCLSSRQALSLLFDTFHNEVDAFLAAEVSSRDQGGILGATFPHSLQSLSPFCYEALRVHQGRVKP